MSGSDITARANAVKQRVALSALIGRRIKLVRAGREWKACCPFHNENTPSFTVNDDKGFYHCFGCGAHGDVIRFKMDHDGLAFLPALEELEQDAGLQAESAAVQRESARPTRQSSYIDSAIAAAAAWQMGQRARGTIAEAWLHARGIDPAASGALDVCRFHPNCPAALWRRWEQPIDARRHAPALITPILAIRGARGERALALRGVHLTFLSADGRGKAYFEPYRDRASGKLVHPAARMMWGSTMRAAVIIPARPIDAQGVELVQALHRLIDAQDSGPAVVAEGLESTLSLMARVATARIGFATLSLGNLQGVAAQNGPKHSVALWRIEGAREQAPFTVSNPGQVIVGVDADMKPTQPQWLQERRGAPAIKRGLTGMERAELCGALAAWHWRRAGAESVQVVRPRAGEDFNDADQRRARA